ncbi:PREDICTED: DNA fragmentation factor subunit beta isoform X3 [Cercocebus atys]|uniref:DNA fragmentation factor subunit beta isoform X3 n=1 Tax=Cercocebus atys TaxID=9531 RepID=UPI0005F49109|nr:PREDICTED: DNA fragmentation factor subunit beta isoform X3 [Cercocebus atys]
MLQKPKSVKLRALRSPRKFGVAGRSCQEVLHKGCLRFQLPERGSRLCLYEDGTELTEDYFPSVPDNAELVLLTSGQAWQGCLESRFQNKSGYLRYSCESRIRSYLREVSSYPSLVGAEAQEEFLRVLGSMCQKLRSVQYNGSYFDRGAKGGGRLCTSEGWFSCQGPFDMDSCLSRHSINPYSNRESRILFSTWNLDHIIEKKRTIIPTLVEAIKEQDGREVDWEYFYSLLFTSENLKLVHIVCHKKTIHKLNCDPNRIYKPQPRLKRKRPVRKR